MASGMPWVMSLRTVPHTSLKKLDSDVRTCRSSSPLGGVSVMMCHISHYVTY